jgi:hypothetical protein
MNDADTESPQRGSGTVANGSNYVLDGDRAFALCWTASARDNIAAICLSKEIEAAGRVDIWWSCEGRDRRGASDDLCPRQKRRRHSNSDGRAVGKPDPRIEDQRRHLARRRAAITCRTAASSRRR